MTTVVFLTLGYHVEFDLAPKNEKIETFSGENEFKQCVGTINAETIPVVHPQFQMRSLADC